MSSRLTILTAAAAFVAAAMAASSATAITTAPACPSPPPDGDTETFSVSPATSYECASGVAPEGPLTLLGMDWTFSQKWENFTGDDSPGDDLGPASPIYFSSFTFGTTEGGWEISGIGASVSDVLLALKQDNAFAGFMLDLSGAVGGVLSGTWSINGGATTDDISHAAIYYKTGVIPLPPAALLIFSGLGVAAVVSRKARRAS